MHWPFIRQSTRSRQGLLAETILKSGSVPKERSFSTLVDTTLLSTQCRSTLKACSSRAVSVHDDLGSHVRISDPNLPPQADNGTLTFWDYDTGTPFQNMDDVPQPGSLEAEAGVFCSTFDQTGTRLITGGADKTIKVGSHRLGRVDPSHHNAIDRFMQSNHNNHLGIVLRLYVHLCNHIFLLRNGLLDFSFVRQLSRHATSNLSQCAAGSN